MYSLYTGADKISHFLNGKGSRPRKDHCRHCRHPDKSNGRCGHIPKQQKNKHDDCRKSQDRKHGFIHCPFSSPSRTPSDHILDTFVPYGFSIGPEPYMRKDNGLSLLKAALTVC